MEYLSLGKIIDSFGLDGTLKIYSTTTNGKLRYQKGAKVFLFNPNDNSETEATVLNYRHNGFFDFVTLDIISNKEDAISKKGCEIHVIKDYKDLDENAYFFSDLENCEIIGKSGKLLGKVKQIEEFPAQITLRVARKNNKDFFVPFVKAFISKVDIENKRIYINEIEGLLWR